MRENKAKTSTGIQKWPAQPQAQRKLRCDVHEMKDFTVGIRTTERRKANEWSERKKRKGRQEGRTRADLALLAVWIVWASKPCWGLLSIYYASVTMMQIPMLAIFFSPTVYLMDIHFVNSCKKRIYDSQQESTISFPIINTHTVLRSEKNMQN